MGELTSKDEKGKKNNFDVYISNHHKDSVLAKTIKNETEAIKGTAHLYLL